MFGKRKAKPAVKSLPVLYIPLTPAPHVSREQLDAKYRKIMVAGQNALDRP